MKKKGDILKENKSTSYLIHRNNYDIVFKCISELFQDDFLHAIGIDVGHVVQMIPTNIITVETTDLEVDFLCLLDDDTYLHLEFQTTSKQEDLDRFMKYDALLYDKYKKPVRTAVIYGADVLSAKSECNYGSITYHVSNIFLNNYDGDMITVELMKKAENEEEFSQEELAKLILLPLMKTSESRSERVIDSGQIARKIKNEEIQNRILAMILAMSHKFLSDEQIDEFLEVMEMNKVFEAIEKKAWEKGIAKGIEQGIEQGIEKGIEQGIEKGLEKGIQGIAEKMLKENVDIKTIKKFTGLSEEEIKNLQ
ncbi:hypothetical protein [Longirhabdus pacifica]|uniref:hypothetical protein n=1 Tax=Longirhabdus pacifica TaxID=2305227 RepID=UPI0010091D70|nr:hypothetical protein [Longirhabdus pacifica]